MRVADAGCVEIDVGPDLDQGGPGSALDRLRRLPQTGPVLALLSAERPDLDALEQRGRADLLARGRRGVRGG